MTQICWICTDLNTKSTKNKGDKIKKREKFLTITIITVILLIKLISCTNTAKESLPTSRIYFAIEPEAGTMSVVAEYLRADVGDNHFVLNRNFDVTRILIDGESVEVNDIVEILDIFYGYEVKKYTLPPFTNSVQIEYTGSLSCEERLVPYARERISPEFTLLRGETFSFPEFMKNDDLFDMTHPKFLLHATVDLPLGYIAGFTFSNAEQTQIGDRAIFTASGGSLFAVAIAKFQIVDTETAIYYFLEDTDTEDAMSRITPIMVHALDFMNGHFGKRTFEKKLRVIEIPTHFGSFARPEENMTFTEGWAFLFDFEMRQLVHEFIHLGWNANVEDTDVQRARFFDEAFTTYFEFRVMSDLLAEETYDWYTLRAFPWSRGIDHSDLVSISEFAIFYGQLSYTLGAFSLYKLSQMIGVELFDQVTKLFLDKYQSEPVDFEKFCSFYIEHSGHPDVEEFFCRWIYTNEYMDEL
jgi:hypothetical protein